MEISIPHAKLIQALELACRISTKHVTLPVLQCVLLSAKDNLISLRATNLELSLEVVLPGSVTEEGVIAVPAQTLLQSLQFVNEANITLRDDEGVLAVELEKTKTSIKSIPHEEFPTFQTQPLNGQVINRQTFSLGIKTTLFAASVSSIKPELGCVYVQQKKEHSLTFVATDSFRLMEKTVPQKGLVLDQSFLLPQKNAQEISRICDSLNEDPQMVVAENLFSLWFPNHNVFVVSRLVSGSFPDYEQIIPKEYVSTVTVLRADLLKSFKKTSIFLNKYLQVSLALSSGVGLTVSAQNSEVGHVTDSVKAVVVGEELNLNFNQNYLADCLSHINDDSLELRFAGIGRPLVIAGVTEKSLRYLVMPMNR